MAFSTASQVRATNDKLENVSDISDLVISDRITEADSTIIVDLSPLYSEADLLSLGSANKTLNLLSTWKAAEILLARIYGTTRQVDQVSDVDYWRKKYTDLLNRVLSGEIALFSSTVEEARNTPSITGSSHRLKLFPTKGIDGFEQGSIDDEF